MTTPRAVLIIAVASLALFLASAGPASAATPVGADPGGTCAGLPAASCFTTVQAAVDNAGPAPAEVRIFPGTYAESVNIADMGGGTMGDLTLRSVDGTGAPAAGAATISPAAGAAIFEDAFPFDGAVTIEGLIVTSPDDTAIEISAVGSISLTSVTANDSFFSGIFVQSNSGDATFTGVTANGNSDDGVEATALTGNITVTGSTASDNDNGGFDLSADLGAVTVSGSTANNNLDNEGFDIFGDANVTITNSEGSGNFDEGFDINSDGNVTITNSQASGNGDEGFDIDTSGDVSITGAVANDSETDEGIKIDTFGNVSITGAVANNNDDDGIDVDAANITVTNATANNNFDEGIQAVGTGDILIDRVTTIGNAGDGVDTEGGFAGEGSSVDNITVRNSNMQQNDSGVEMLEDVGTVVSGALLVNSNVLCGNVTSGLASLDDAPTSAEGNWWGNATGPTHPINNPTGTGEDVLDGANQGAIGALGTVDFTPWIDTASGSGSAVAGQASNISFEFTGGAGAVKLQEGPGDTTGAPAFSATTSNGTAATSGFISGGKLTVALTAATAGTANVAVTGPCGLTGVLAVAVAAAPVAPTPTPAALPPTGGTNAGGSNPALFAALLGLAASAVVASALALRRPR